jgi:Brp/Blh family beta-carotene 15,15'-monooxygenase
MKVFTSAVNTSAAYALTFSLVFAYQSLVFDLQGIPLWVIALFIFIFGVPHGAADTLIFKKMCDKAAYRDWLIFGACYLVAVSAIIILWILSPLLFICYLLIVSAIHFGDDLHGEPKFFWLSKIYGCSVVLCPSLLWRTEVEDLFVPLVGMPSAMEVTNVTHSASLIALTMLGLLVYLNRNALSTKRVETIFWATLTLILLKPILGFTLYFCFWHSRLHILRLIRLRYIDSSFISMALLIVPMIMTLLGVLYIAYFVELMNDPNIARVLFVGLGALTLPHLHFVATLNSSR